MSFESTSHTHTLNGTRQIVFLTKELFLDEITSCDNDLHTKTFSKDFITALHTLQQRYTLVVLVDEGGYDSIFSLLHTFDIELSFYYTHLPLKETLDASTIKDILVVKEFYQQQIYAPLSMYLIQPHFKLSLIDPSVGQDATSFLEEVLTLSFFNYDELVSWILSHPTSYQSLITSLHSGAKILENGGLVAFPTETVYGLGADATNPDAVERIFSAKQRPFFDPLIVHLSHKDQVGPLVRFLPEKAEILITHFWPGPLTIVLPKSDLVPDIVTAGHPSVALRMPNNRLALELIRLSNKPIAAPSANKFGCTSPTTAQHVLDQLEGEFEKIIDGGGCTVGIESTVISFLEEIPIILRPGGIDQQTIESVIGKVAHQVHDSSQEMSTSPGMLPSHYATSTPLVIVDDYREYASRSDVGVLLFGKSEYLFTGPVEYLSPSSNPAEAAKRLYQAMRKLDSLSLSLLVVKLLPETGIGIAVNNRLTKAAGNFQPKRS